MGFSSFHWYFLSHPLCLGTTCRRPSPVIACWAWTRVCSLRSRPGRRWSGQSLLVGRPCDNKLVTSVGLPNSTAVAAVVAQPVPTALILALRDDLDHFRYLPTLDHHPNRGVEHTFFSVKKLPSSKNTKWLYFKVLIDPSCRGCFNV